MQPSKTILIVLAGAALAGCRTKAPPTTSEIQQQSGVSRLARDRQWTAAPVSSNVPEDNWLATFGDTQLDALVSEALAHNPDLRVAFSKVEQAGEYVGLAKSALRPNLNLLGTGGFNMGGGDVSSALQGVSLGGSWEPDLWGRMRYGRNAAQASYASAKADFEFARQSLAASTAKCWFAATEAWQERQISEDMVKAADGLLTLATKRRNIGPGSEQDIVLARANLGNIQDTAKQTQLAYEQSLRALELLVGRYPAAEIASRPDFGKLPEDIPAGLPIQMLERRPDMIAAERRVAVAFNHVGEAKAARLPRIFLNANVAVVESDVLQLKKDFQNPVAGAGLKFIAPIYQGGALQTKIRIRSLEQKQAIAEYARLALRAIGDVEDALATAQSLSDRERGLNQVLADSERVLVLAQTSYRVGRGDLRAVQQQQLNVQTARMALLRVQSEQRIQRVNLHLALGGSFELPPTELSFKTEKPK
jgi:NodT family efflux transporter outer membrane factor (OMF) lipoprotein